MIKKYFFKYLWSIWAGGAFTAFSGFKIFDWQWWVFIIPLVALVVLSWHFEKQLTHPAYNATISKGE